MQGVIIKGVGGLYFVKVQDKVIECKARGKFRYTGLSPVIGDKVEIMLETDESKGVIEKIFPRETEMIRPVVANVTQAFVVFAFKQPDLNMDLLNKFLVLCEHYKLKIVLCLNKLDLVEQVDEGLIKELKSVGCDIVFLKAKEGDGLSELKTRIKDNITVFCGPSGVGKSTILNSILGREAMKTGDISKKSQKGKHTTRHSELIEYEEGFLLDTPGFSALSLDFIEKEQLQDCFPEFEKHRCECRFSNCMHYKEPNCRVKQAVEDNEIYRDRYKFYIKTLEEIIARGNKK
ncbi:ribosome small subunit-dependent GTPase A [Clostridium sp. CM028]|uniref:ribosome small subunit-dependent GTPase A n=1 Tax=Clostridium TaxID=1485 RepID=UPI0013EEC2D1|nr:MULTISPECIES: ribosome small subunit-dependent GTPase A [Clostridium]MBU3091601.1 ribosome small subunit-dependent GTPase A [Clostridium sp. CF011]MBW9144134.1 ribosome small subunit-dependent GTPase A [Clostridium sp. CM027]MBW9147555.1 ribosome small subunit-dependent GTPase A [Clostridium sp. CM028]MBZ9608344.1 ribosome small subunit-dependent GTPase A [Clostridium estertheticum]UVE41223.1 ribosome small subunit-dependent GTPase A [Clostridium sp. CM027]